MAAVRTTIIKNTNLETIVKFEGSSADTAATIDISTLTASTQALVAGGTPTVNIVKLISSGLLTSGVSIARNSVVVLACAPENSPIINLTQDGISDTIQNDQDIVITLTGAASVGYLVLRKVAGWETKVENATYGAYDDPTRVGASTSLSGSPDKV
jgi:hypothetical protein